MTEREELERLARETLTEIEGKKGTEIEGKKGREAAKERAKAQRLLEQVNAGNHPEK